MLCNKKTAALSAAVQKVCAEIARTQVEQPQAAVLNIDCPNRSEGAEIIKIGLSQGF